MKSDFYMPNAILQAIGAQNEKDAFDKAMMLDGKAFRDVPGRKTSQLVLAGKSYFIKQHHGVGWKEIIKNWLSFKKPVLSAMTEVGAIKAVTSLGVETTPLVAYGARGCNPAGVQSFMLTEDLGDIISLEDLCADWENNPPDDVFKRNLIIAVAELSKILHFNGINHRDFYLCHLCIDKATVGEVDKPIKLYVIDLHRALLHRRPSKQANMKDIAALYFSSMDVGLDAADWALFKQHYVHKKLNIDEQFWENVEARALQLYKKFHSAKFQAKLAEERSKL